MDTDGGSAGTRLTCARDGAETRLQCTECGSPICPECFVRTAVGLRCERCGVASGPPVRSWTERSRRGPLLAAAAVVVALIVAGGAWAATRGGGGHPADEVAEGGERITVPPMTLGRGELPGGVSWTLDARRDGSVCTTLTLSPGPPARERCLSRRSYRPVGNTLVRPVRAPGGTFYVTLGQTSDRAERVRVAPEGAAPYEVPTLGGGTGLDVRFFVAHTTENVAVTFTALTADGTELGRMNRPVLPSN